MKQAELIRRFKMAEQIAGQHEKDGNIEGMKKWEQIATKYLKAAEKLHNN